MKVKCIKINEDEKNYSVDDNSIKVGKDYLVLQVEASPNQWIRYYILCSNDRDKHSILCDASQFEIISKGIPKNWEVSQEDGVIKLGPKAWKISGFWNRLGRADDVEIKNIYLEEVRLMIQEEYN